MTNNEGNFNLENKVESLLEANSICLVGWTCGCMRPSPAK